MTIIAIDYDSTYTAEQSFFDAMFGIAKAFGVEFVCISARENNEQNRIEIESNVPVYVPVHLTSGKAKKPYAKQAGLNIDIWIDDNPERIQTSSASVIASQIANTKRMASQRYGRVSR